jgi:hypothetical protein
MISLAQAGDNALAWCKKLAPDAGFRANPPEEDLPPKGVAIDLSIKYNSVSY